MFNEIPASILERMEQLRRIDARDRTDGTTRLVRLRQVPRETGKFIALWAAAAPEGRYLEIGTSAGFSTLWLALACRTIGRRITTFEVLPEKLALAKETFACTGVGDVVDQVAGDARDYLSDISDISFCFLDAEKEVYKDCYDLIVPRMVTGGILIADNAIDHRDTLQPLIDEALADPRLDAMVVPIEKGELVCRKK
ncbi:MAG: O-methyltransferase [Candidatus Latescibacteria bacterium]|jgi:caffeoyl-CoA O-methyltransferase|nr:O-methyltransferase [Candidatus Latescibacterota bacterium]